ncbi:MAG TPA: hypothetical protein DC054_08100 [Blastocatellia bacterium]|nr:hypothetical protein [Blastocatellia bacterium]
MSTSPDVSATEIRRQDNEPHKELLKRREQIAGMLVEEHERQTTADSFIVRGEIDRHIRALEQQLASIDSELTESVQSDTPSRKTLRFSRVVPIALFGVVAFAILVLPFWIVAFPPLLDYPNHLARVFILAHLHDPAFHFSEYYASDWGPYPYLTMDVLMVLLQKFCNVFLAGKILLSLSVVGVPFASWFFVRQAHPKNVLLAGLSLITTWNLFFLWGFINMQLSMALVLLVVGLWLRYLRRPSWPQWIIFLLTVIALYFTHLLGFGIAGLAVAGYCLLTRKTFRQLVLGCVPFALGALTHVITRIAIAGATSRQPNDPWEVIWRPFSEKAEGLGSFMQGYSPRMDQITVIVLVVACLAAWWRNREFHWNRPWALFIAGLFVLYWIFPAGYGVGADADLRLLPFILLFVPVVASFGKRTRWLFVVLLLLFVARSAVITKTFLAKQPELAGMARSFPVTPANVRVLPIVEAKSQEDQEPPQLRPYAHFWAYGTIERGWFTPYLFAERGLQVLQIKAETTTPDGFWDLEYKEEPEWQDIAEEYDYVWSYNVAKYAPQLQKIGDVVFKDGDLTMYRIKKPKEADDDESP